MSKPSESPVFNKLRTFVERLVLPTDLEWSELLKIVQIKRLKQNAIYIQQDEFNNFGCFVIEGLLELFYATEDGLESTFRFSTESEFAGGYAGLVTNSPSECSVRALEDSIVCEIPYKQWLSLMSMHRNWETVGRKIAEAEFVYRAKREKYLLILDGKERYRHFRDSRPDLIERIPQHKIASYLGMTPVSLSRIVSQLRREG